MMILVTGGTGLVGAHLLVSLTQQNEKIRAIHRESSSLEVVKNVFSYYYDDIEPFYSQIEWIVADIVDITSLEKAFKGITHVYHAAAIVSFSPKDYWKMRKINIEGTANIVNFSIAQNVKKLCYVSSIAAVDKTPKNGFIDETGDWSVETNNYGYAITKHGAETEVWRGTQEGLDAVIVNPGVILGSGSWNTSSGQIFSKVHDGLRFYTEGTTGYVGVKDVVKAMVQLMESDIINERFILVAENLQLKELLFQIADAFGKKRPSIKVSKMLSEIAWRIASIVTIFGIQPTLTKQTASSIHNQYYFSNKKIESAIGLIFEPISKTIRETCREYRKDVLNIKV